MTFLQFFVQKYRLAKYLPESPADGKGGSIPFYMNYELYITNGFFLAEIVLEQSC